MTLTVSAQAGSEQGLLEALHSVMVAAQVEPNCTRAYLSQDVNEPRVLHYAEEWRNERELERWIRSRQFGRLLALMETASEAPVLQFDVAAETRGLPYVAALRGGATNNE
jgi:quinol monooxygenase YgiN